MRRLLLATALFLLVLVAPSVVHADVNSLTIQDYSIDYTLEKDKNTGRSALTTVETITAQFPDINQNHGIERAIPQSYDEHPVKVSINSVQKSDGTAWNYTTYDDGNDNLVIRIGDANTYVHGEQTYIITYKQFDVTKYFADTNDDEFYWDTNGTDWQVPIDSLSVTLNLGANLGNNLNGRTACYQGAARSVGGCELNQHGATFTTTASNLSPGQNITFAVGFTAGTFQPYEPSALERLISTLLPFWLGLLAVSVVVIVWLAVKVSAVRNRKKELGTIVTEYLPPNDASITVAATVLDAPKAVFAAQLLDFAVRHYIKLHEIESTSFLWIKSKDYEIEIVKDISELRAEEREILEDIFGSSPVIGDRLRLGSLKNNTAVYRRTQDNTKKLKKLVRGEYELRSKDPKWNSWLRKFALVLLLLGLATLNPGFLIAALLAFGWSFTLWILTDSGLALRRYLLGLEVYIKVAEVDRLKMLQSPEGAQKVSGTDPNDKTQLIKLYEKVLPYAVLFGQEKEWNKQIGTLYQDTGKNPDWYSGRAAFSAAAFGSTMSSFSSSASYSAASSSSTGGSSGGGSSGGGGGGGGGGGW